MSPSGQGAIRIGLSPWGGGPRLFTRTGEASSHRGSLGISVVDVVSCFSYAPFTLLSALLPFPEVQAAPGQPNTPLSELKYSTMAEAIRAPRPLSLFSPLLPFPFCLLYSLARRLPLYIGVVSFPSSEYSINQSITLCLLLLVTTSLL